MEIEIQNRIYTSFGIIGLGLPWTETTMGSKIRNEIAKYFEVN